MDGLKYIYDNKKKLTSNDFWPLNGININPMEKKPIKETLDVGIRAINCLFTVGRGQRLGIVAGSGVGKSVLLGMMTRFTSAHVVVVGLIGVWFSSMGGKLSFVKDVY